MNLSDVIHWRMKTPIIFLLIFFLEIFGQLDIKATGEQENINVKRSPLIQYLFGIPKEKRFFQIFSKDFAFKINQYGQLYPITTQVIPRDAVILKVQKGDNIISISNIKKNYTINGIEDMTLFCLFLYFEKHRCDNQGTLYRAYIDDISFRHSNLKTPLYWEENLLNELQESYVKKKTIERKNELKKMYESITPNILKHFPLNCPKKSWKNVLNFEEFKWIYSIVYYKKLTYETKLFPLFDLFHFPEAPKIPNIFFDLSTSQNYSLISFLKATPPNERIYFNQPAPSQILLLNHGMCVMTNPTSTFIFIIEKYLDRFLKENPNHKIIKRWLKKMKIDNIKQLEISSTTKPYEVDDSLILFLRLVSVHSKDIKLIEKELPKFSKKVAIHKKNEYLMVKKLKYLFEKLLIEYSTTLEEDEKLFKEKMNVDLLNCAILVRMNEKRALKEIIQKIKDMKT